MKDNKDRFFNKPWVQVAGLVSAIFSIVGISLKSFGFVLSIPIKKIAAYILLALIGLTVITLIVGWGVYYARKQWIARRWHNKCLIILCFSTLIIGFSLAYDTWCEDMVIPFLKVLLQW